MNGAHGCKVGGVDVSKGDNVAHDSDCWDDWTTELAFFLFNLNGLDGGHWGQHCCQSHTHAHMLSQAWVPPHMNGDKCNECLRFPTRQCYTSKWLIHIVGPCLLSATAYSKAMQLVPICVPLPHHDPTACVGIRAYRGSNSLPPLMPKLFLVFLPLYF